MHIATICNTCELAQATYNTHRYDSWGKIPCRFCSVIFMEPRDCLVCLVSMATPIYAPVAYWCSLDINKRLVCKLVWLHNTRDCKRDLLVAIYMWGEPLQSLYVRIRQMVVFFKYFKTLLSIIDMHLYHDGISGCSLFWWKIFCGFTKIAKSAKFVSLDKMVCVYERDFSSGGKRNTLSLFN